MFDDNFDDTAGQYELSSIESIRDAALIMYGRFIAHMYGEEPNDERAKLSRNHLSLQETENIVRDYSSVSGDGIYAVGGDTAEDAKKKINEMMAALMDRVMSNVLAAGVKQDLLDCNYDTNKNDFSFTVTDKGKQIAETLRKNGHKPNRPDIQRDKEI